MPTTNPLIAARRGFLKVAAPNMQGILKLAFQRKDTGAQAFLNRFVGSGVIADAGGLWHIGRLNPPNVAPSSC